MTKMEEDFEFVKWLPHTWSNDKTIRYIATNENEVKEVSTYLEKEINKRRELRRRFCKRKNAILYYFCIK